MTDLTILLATANLLDEKVAERIRANLLLVTKGQYPIISVSQKPMDFGQNICVGEIGVNKYSEYKQILIGTKEVKTKYVAVIDDDVLYCPEHFLYRPPKGYFSDETNYWFAQDGLDYYWRVKMVESRGGMWSFISETDNLVNNLTKRYEMYPENPLTGRRQKLAWGEPGYSDEQFGMENKLVKVHSEKPCVIFIHSKSMGYTQLRRFYRRYGWPTEENKTDRLEQFGTMEDLRYNYWK